MLPKAKTVYFHVDVNSAFLSWTAIQHLANGETLDLRTVPAVVGGDEEKRHGVVLAKSRYRGTGSAHGGPRRQGPRTRAFRPR